MLSLPSGVYESIKERKIGKLNFLPTDRFAENTFSMSEPQQVKEQKEAVGGRNDEQQDVSAIDTSAAGSNILNPVGGGLAEPAADLKPGEGDVQDMPGDSDKLQKLSGDVGTVKGPGLGSVQGGVDARGGTDAPDMAQQADTGKLDGSDADISKA